MKIRIWLLLLQIACRFSRNEAAVGVWMKSLLKRGTFDQTDKVCLYKQTALVKQGVPYSMAE
jgi:hypothetical protein